MSGGEVAGFAYACRHRERAAYRWAADVSVYVGADARRSGVGRFLYAALLGRLRGMGFQVACAGIALPNEASVALHESFGFEPVGVYRRIGWKAGPGVTSAGGSCRLPRRAPVPPRSPARRPSRVPGYHEGHV